MPSRLAFLPKNSCPLFGMCAKELECLWLSSKVVRSAEELLFTYRLRGGASDKALFKRNGFCKSLSDFHWGDSIIFGHRFSVWGWAQTPRLPRALVREEII